MNETQLRTIEQVEAFLRGSVAVEFSAVDDGTCYVRQSASRKQAVCPADNEAEIRNVA